MISWLGLNEAQVHSAGVTGLLHDLVKAKTPMQVLNKPGKLTEAEYLIMQKHPMVGYDMLSAAPDMDPVVLDVCLHHHEKTDGSGHPQGLQDKEISLFAKMGAVCDVYDAITSNRPYKVGWDPAESLRKMAEWSKGHFDLPVFQAFVKSVGIYPTGSLVMLSSGLLAVVIEQSKASLMTPRVSAFYSTRTSERITPKRIDLSSLGCVDKIAQREDPCEMAIARSQWHVDEFDIWTARTPRVGHLTGAARTDLGTTVPHGTVEFELADRARPALDKSPLDTMAHQKFDDGAAGAGGLCSGSAKG